MLSLYVVVSGVSGGQAEAERSRTIPWNYRRHCQPSAAGEVPSGTKLKVRGGEDEWCDGNEQPSGRVSSDH
ncbi:MAG TPA: hypothetical protein VFV83_03730 [Chthoniobacteraceae bacterium]|nr:hypothetical protein [Chthoniobacteraceae bacterium]